MSKSVLVIGTGTIGEPLIGLMADLRKKLGIDNVVTLKGPSFAVEVIEHADTLLTLGYTTLEQYNMVKEALKDTAIYIDSTIDIRGVELLSVMKNIYVGCRVEENTT